MFYKCKLVVPVKAASLEQRGRGALGCNALFLGQSAIANVLLPKSAADERFL